MSPYSTVIFGNQDIENFILSTFYRHKCGDKAENSLKFVESEKMFILVTFYVPNENTYSGEIVPILAVKLGGLGGLPTKLIM